MPQRAHGSICLPSPLLVTTCYLAYNLPTLGSLCLPSPLMVTTCCLACDLPAHGTFQLRSPLLVSMCCLPTCSNDLLHYSVLLISFVIEWTMCDMCRVPVLPCQASWRSLLVGTSTHLCPPPHATSFQWLYYHLKDLLHHLPVFLPHPQPFFYWTLMSLL